MYIGPIEAAVQAPPIDKNARGSVVFGMLVLIVMVPWLAIRLLAHCIATDLRRISHGARAIAEEVNAARR